MAPKKRVRAAAKINTEGLDDPELQAAADNKDMKRSDGSGGSKFGGAAAGGGLNPAQKHITQPPERYPVLPGKVWTAEDVTLTAREKEICKKARFLSTSYHYSGFFVRPAALPGQMSAAAASKPLVASGAPATVAPATTAAASLPTTSQVAALHEVARYSDKYRLIDGKRDLFDEIPAPSEQLFPKDLIKRVKKKQRTGLTTSATLNFDAQFEALSADDAVRLDADGRVVVSTLSADALAALGDDGEPSSNVPDFLVNADATDPNDPDAVAASAAAGAGGKKGGKKGAKKGDGDEDDDEAKAAAAAEGGGDPDAAEPDVDEEDELGGGDYTEHYDDDDEDGNDAFGDDDGATM